MNATCGPDPYAEGEGTRYVCAGHLGTGAVTDGPETSISFIIRYDSSVTWLWRLQYYLTIVSEHGNPQGTGWYNAGATASWSVTSPWPSIQVRVETGIRYVTDPVSGTVLMNAPKTVTVLWSTQFLLRAVASPDYVIFGEFIFEVGEVDFLPEGEPANEVVSIPEFSLHWRWYSPGTVVQLTATPESIYVFGYWSGDLSGTERLQILTIDGPRA